MVDVDAGSFLVIVCCSALAALVASVVQPRLAIPVVVMEILLGILVGPKTRVLQDETDASSSSRLRVSRKIKLYCLIKG